MVHCNVLCAGCNLSLWPQGGGHDKLKEEREQKREKKNKNSKKKKQGMSKGEKKAKKKKDLENLTEKGGKGLN